MVCGTSESAGSLPSMLVVSYPVAAWNTSAVAAAALADVGVGVGAAAVGAVAVVVVDVAAAVDQRSVYRQGCSFASA